MRKWCLSATILLALSLPAAAQTQAITAGISKPTTPIIISKVTVINVVTGKAEPDQTVVIDSNRITAVGSIKKIKVPANGTVIDGSGKYLMPGMTDAHIHFFQSGGLYTRPDGANLQQFYPYEKDQQWVRDNLYNQMARYLACGITRVIDVGGPMSNYAVRDSVNAQLIAPEALVTGPLVSTYLPPNLDKKDPPIVKVTTAEEARALVKKQLPLKPDFIKIWYIVLPGQKPEATLPIVQAAIEESHAAGLKVAVHATEYETAKLAVTAGADILVHSVDDKVLDTEMLQLLKSKQVVYIPTLLVSQGYSRTFTQQFNFTAHDFTYGDPFMLGTLSDLQHIEKSKLPFDYKSLRSRMHIPDKGDSTMLTNLKLAQEAGVLVVAGTDAGNIGTLHASSFFAELLAMQQAGLSNAEILRSATINAAKGFGKDKAYGTIEKGKIADLLLLDKDPLQDLTALGNIQTVIHRGVPMQSQHLLPVTPEILAQQQLNAYNARNIDAFLQPYSDSVRIYSFPDKLMVQGKEAMRKQYSGMFERVKELHCKLVNRIVQGDTVIDQESVTGFGDKPLSAIAIYKIKNGKIAEVYFIQ
ncbi:amidohydrolase family protein [Paraflavitalea sp. CAU 1676]|uniref:amidohydrolase family protein n=1 Tax=Paraflavitalea sp. CAU 1676 TaxID=3032598 RepID=UPI0023DA074A|nr:amidohydrolase family protein [Paraflavitalea sp. CAU 1676]MDF2189919.1 amidohydrolase family protein [Paraflavitalea sp. CAU 1676]